MLRFALVMAIAGGCYYEPALPIDQSKLISGPNRADEAAALTCGAFKISTCPRVFWYGPAASDCPNGFLYDGVCVSGLQGEEGILTFMAWEGMPVSQSALVHELAHYQWGDAGHSNLAIWGPNGWTESVQMRTPGTKVGDQNSSLAGLGM